jgi:nucleotide-binding universal stress UspA family protein
VILAQTAAQASRRDDRDELDALGGHGRLAGAARGQSDELRAQAGVRIVKQRNWPAGRLSRRVTDEGLYDAEPEVASGLAAEQLVGIADSHKAELIVVGYRGRGLVKSTPLGSVSRDVLSLARCPVAVVPARDTA